MNRLLTADRGDAGRRLDLVLRRHLADVDEATRTRVQAWIENGLVTVNGAPVRRVAARAAFGDLVSVVLPEPAPRTKMGAEDIGLDKLTSGLVVVARTAEAHAKLQRVLSSTPASTHCEKEYLAVVYGHVKARRGVIDLRLAPSRTDRRRIVASATAGAASLTRFERIAHVAAPRVG